MPAMAGTELVRPEKRTNFEQLFSPRPFNIFFRPFKDPKRDLPRHGSLTNSGGKTRSYESSMLIPVSVSP